MKIAAVTLYRVSLPVRRAHEWAGLGADQRIGHGYIIVRMRLENGVEGLGEAPTLAQWGGEFGTRYGEGSESARVVIEKYLVPQILGEDVREIENLHARMNARVVGHPYAKAALDQAMHDAIGKLYGVPVYQLLGGRVRERVPICHSIGLMPLEAAVAEAREAIDEGVQTLKIKVGCDPQRDVLVVQAVRKAVGDDIGIRIDANQGYRSWKDALRTIHAMSDANLLLVEQPVQGLENMARVAQSTQVPIMADESVWDIHDVRRIMQLQAAEMLSIYYTKPGGLQQARKVATMAEAGSLRCDVNGSGETGVGNAANLHLAAASLAVDLPCTLPVNSRAEARATRVVNRFYEDDIVKESFRYEDGYLILPEAPGLGVELDEEKLQRYALRD